MAHPVLFGPKFYRYFYNYVKKVAFPELLGSLVASKWNDLIFLTAQNWFLCFLYWFG